MSESTVLERLSPARRRIALALLGALVLWFSWSVRAVLNPIILAYLLAYVLQPLVRAIERRGRSRQVAVNLIFISFSLLLGLTVFGLIAQGRSLWVDLEEKDVFDRVEAELGDVYERFGGWLEPLTGGTEAETEAGGTGADGGGSEPASASPAETANPHPANSDLAQTGADAERADESWLRSLYGDLRAFFEANPEAGRAGVGFTTGAWKLARQLFGSVFAFLTLVLVLPIYTYFLLFELERIHAFVGRYLPRRDRDQIVRIGGQIGQVLANFFRGRMFVCLIKGLLIAGGLAACGVPYSFLIGITSGFLSIVPFVGPFVGFLGAFLFAMLEFSFAGALWRTAAVYVAAELIEGYVLLPKILGDTLGMHPVVVLASLTIGAAAFGMFGLLIALPLTASLIILVRELVLPALAQEAGHESADGDGPGDGAAGPNENGPAGEPAR